MEGGISKENVSHVKSDLHLVPSKPPFSPTLASWNCDPIKYQQMLPISHISPHLCEHFLYSNGDLNLKNPIKAIEVY